MEGMENEESFKSESSSDLTPRIMHTNKNIKLTRAPTITSPHK